MSTIADRKADLLAFCVIYEALDDIAQVTTDPDQLKKLESVLSRGVNIIRRDFDDYKSLILDSFSEVSERYAQITKLKQVHQAVKPDTFILRSVILVRALLSRVRAVQDDFQREFTPKMQRVVRDIIRAVEQELPSDRLTCLASTPISSPWAQGFSWMREAIRTVIPELTSVFEEAALEEAMAEAIGTDIREANNVLKGDPANTKAKRKRKSSLQEATDLVQASSNPDTSKAISSAIKNTSGYVTKIGQKLNLNPDKESCVTLRGKGIIAAGAGSGKTLAMAAKVVYTIDELGFNPKEVIATSFTKKASKELQERIKKFGNEDMIKQSDNTIGTTTHSIATSILKKNGINIPFLSDAETNALIRTAIAQVGMSPTEDSMYLVERFDLYGRGIDRDPRKEDQLLRKLSEFTRANESWDESNDPRIQNYQKMLSSIILGIETGDLRLYTERMGRDTSTKALDPKYDRNEWGWVFGANGWLNKAKNFRADLGDPSLSSDPEFMQRIEQFFSMKTMKAFLNSGARRTASIEELEEGTRKPTSRSISPQYATKPANKWFNLGWSKADSELSEKEVSMFIGKNKSSGISPETALDAAEEETIPLVAAYAAYEFLRNNDFGINPGALGFDDILIKFVRTLVTDPVVRKNVQSQFKVVIVDEAQDLNDVQHKMFGLIAGALDPETLEFRADGKMTADTYTMIGDDFQCVDGDAVVLTLDGQKKVRDLGRGDMVQSFVNDKSVFCKVRNTQRSSWEESLELVTESGRRLRMSPNHRLWATELEGEFHLLYLMYRPDFGFRIGVTNRGKNRANPYGNRVNSEGAERLWVLGVYETKEEAQIAESVFSLRYQVSTCVFRWKGREISGARCETLFEEFGQNGFSLLDSLHYSFDFPHYVPQSSNKNGRPSYKINFNAHKQDGTMVHMEWGQAPEDLISSIGEVIPLDENSYRFRVQRSSYAEAYDIAMQLKEKTGLPLCSRITVNSIRAMEMPCSQVFVGMRVPVYSGESFVMEKVVEVNQIPQGDLWDLDVENSMNFVANGILTHNSIYAFRGSSPNTFVQNSDLKNGPFKTIMLTTNYRSARSIVEAGNAIIKHNTDQLPKICDVPKDKEDGAIIAIQTDTFENSCEFIAEDIVKSVKMENASYDSFGIGTRTNAEVDSILLSLIERGIPFKSKRNPFDSKLYRSLTSWLKLSDAASLTKSEINGIVENAYEGGPFMLDMEFKTSLRSMAKNENFYDYLLSGRPVYEGRHAWRNATTVASYAKALKAIVDLGAQNPTTLDLLNAIMELQGPKGKTFGQVILKSKQDDDDTVESEESKETIESVITPIYRLAKNIEDASSCVRYLNDIMKTSKSLKIEEDPKPAVVVDTVHSWKGLECDSMYVMMQPNIFPHKRVETDEGLQEERRLAYVAVTRGRNQVKILMPDKNMRNEDIFSNDPKTKAVMSPYASEACIPFTRV